jgi:hypothetical protein
MCGSSQTSTNTAQSTTLPAWATSAGQTDYNNASTIANNGFTPYSGPTTAAFGAGTGEAQNAASSALGTNNPNYNAATGDINSVISGITPNQSISSLENPYTAGVLAPTLQQLGIANNQAVAQNGAAADLSGDFGGSNYAVQSALNNNNYQQNVANATNQAYSQAYNAAQAQQNTQNNEITSGANALSGVGTAENTQQNTLDQLLASIGGQQQQAGQTGITNAIQLNTQNQTEPLSMQQTLAQILGMSPMDTSGTGSSTTTVPDNTGYALLGSLLSGL